jgi:putative transcriptional regulator
MAAARLENALKVERAKRDWTQERLAHEVGVTRKTINLIEKGREAPSVYLALKLAKVLECQVEQLFQLAEDRIWGKSPFSP